MKKIVVCLLTLSLLIFNNSVYAIMEADATAPKNINQQAALKAFDKYNAILTSNPRNEDALVNRAYIFYLFGNIEQAIQDYNALIEISPKNPDYYLNRGFLNHISNIKSAALEDYQTALKIKPDYAYVYNNLGVILSEMGKPQESLVAYNKAIKINPEYADAYYNRGNLKSLTDKNEEALEDFNTAIKLNPADAASFNNRGVVKRKLNYDVGALSDFTIAIKLDPDDMTALANRGHLKKRFFDSKGAEEDFKDAVLVADNNPVLVKELQLREQTETMLKPAVIDATPVEVAFKTAPAPMNKALRMPKVTPTEAKKIIEKYTNPQPVVAAASSKTVKASVVKINPIGNTKSESELSNSNKKPVITTIPVKNPELAECYYIRALQKYILQNREAALADFNQAITYNPNYAEAYYYRAAIKRDLKDDSFIQDYKKATEIKPELKSIDEANVLNILKN